MIFKKLPLNGAYIIDLEKIEDSRGFFARIQCKNEFEDVNLDSRIVQINNSYNKYKGTLRGIHYQLSPKAETKIIRCITGSIWDVILDLRKDSPTFGNSYGAILSGQNRRMMYVPKGFGHAFITMEKNTEIIYFATEFYSPENERIIRWDDSRFKIDWPVQPIVISDKDKNAESFDEEYHLGGDE